MNRHLMLSFAIAAGLAFLLLVSGAVVAAYSQPQTAPGAPALHASGGAVSSASGGVNEGLPGSFSEAPAPAPTCGPGSDYIIEQSQGVSIVPGTNLVPGSQCDDCVLPINLPFTCRLYGQTFTSANLGSNGNLQFTGGTDEYFNTCLPSPVLTNTILPYWDDLVMDQLPSQGIYTSTTGTAPNRVLNIEWRATNFFGTANVNFEVRLYEGQDRFDFVYGQVDQGGNTATVGVQKDAGSQFTQFECNTGGLAAGTQLRFRTLACGEATFTPTATATPLPTCGPNTDYLVSQPVSATLVPATSLVANSRCDDCTVAMTLPFTYLLYGQPFSAVKASSNGNLQFSSDNNDYFNVCLPAATLDDAIFAYWDDLLTDQTPGAGIYTSTTGTAPERVFTVEWRAAQFANNTPVNFEVRLYESHDRFDIIYAQVDQSGSSATVGVQKDTGGGTGARYTQYSCSLPNLQGGSMLVFTQTACGTSTPTVTLTSTNSPTSTPTGTPTNTATDTPTDTPTATPTSTSTDTPTDTPTSTPTSTPSDTNTPTDTPTNTPTNTATFTYTPTSTPTNTPSSTPTPTDTPTFTCTPTSTPTSTPTFTDTPTATSTATPTNTPTFTSTATATDTPTSTSTSTPTDTASSTPTNTATATSTFTNTPTDTPTETATSTPTPLPALLVGHLVWQGRPAQPDDLQQLPVTLTLRLHPGGPDLEYTGLTTDPNGVFTVTVTGLAGEYDWRVKSAQVGASPPDYNPGFLATGGTLTLSGNPVTEQEMGLQRAGDCNNDNIVSAPDFILLKNAFGKVRGQVGFDNRADITGEGVVNVIDFTQLKLNFGFSGAPPIR